MLEIQRPSSALSVAFLPSTGINSPVACSGRATGQISRFAGRFRRGVPSCRALWMSFPSFGAADRAGCAARPRNSFQRGDVFQ